MNKKLAREMREALKPLEERFGFEIVEAPPNSVGEDVPALTLKNKTTGIQVRYDERERELHFDLIRLGANGEIPPRLSQSPLAWHVLDNLLSEVAPYTKLVRKTSLAFG